MKYRRLGKAGPGVSALGLGCMGMSTAYGEPDADLARLADTFTPGITAGTRYPEGQLRGLGI